MLLACNSLEEEMRDEGSLVSRNSGRRGGNERKSGVRSLTRLELVCITNSQDALDEKMREKILTGEDREVS